MIAIWFVWGFEQKSDSAGIAHQEGQEAGL